MNRKFQSKINVSRRGVPVVPSQRGKKGKTERGATKFTFEFGGNLPQT